MKKENELRYLTKLEIMLKYKKLEESKYGRTSTLYQYNDNQILKLFNLNKEYDKEKYELLCNMKLKNFAIPVKLISIYNKLYGYIMDKKDGIMSSNINNKILLDDFLSNINEIEEDIKELSNFKIVIRDLHEENILYDDISKKISIIDIDEYHISRQNSKDEITNLNLKIFYMRLLDIISLHYNGYYFYLKDFIRNEIKKENYNGKIIFKSIFNDLENKCNNKIVNIEDYNNTIKELIY